MMTSQINTHITYNYKSNIPKGETSPKNGVTWFSDFEWSKYLYDFAVTFYDVFWIRVNFNLAFCPKISLQPWNDAAKRSNLPFECISKLLHIKISYSNFESRYYEV